MRAEDWRPAAEMMLEPTAMTAATSTSGNLVITAGPGSGKTELLAQRADFLLQTGLCRYPRRILAISFKVDAAKNLAERVRGRVPPQLASRLDSYTFHAFAKRLIDTFRPVLTGSYALDRDYVIGDSLTPPHQIDFQSLAPLATAILQSSAVARSTLRHTYGFVFLDEFQDCTTNQYSLVRAAFHNADVSLAAVGDVKQRIMGWAGALDGVLARFAEDFAATRIILYRNYRSQPRLQRVQNAIVKVMEPGDAVPDDSIAADGGTVEIQRYQSSDEEAVDLANKIHGWINVDGTRPDHIAVLVSKQVGLYTEPLRAELRARSIPFREESQLQDLASEPLATLIVDFLLVITEDRRPDAYERLMDVASGWQEDDEENAQRAYASIRQFIDKERLAHQQDPQSSLRASAERFLDHVGDDVLVTLAPEYQQGTRMRDVIEEVFTRLAGIFTQTTDLEQTLREFAGANAVKLMTVHKAKGLEFENVVVLGVEREMFWADLRDERAAFFVAISRARKHLCLTVAQTRPRPTGAPANWEIVRQPQTEFLSYAEDQQG